MAFAQRYPSPPQSQTPRARLPRPLRTAEHTLGPTFSDEEDGDDSAYIASKMAVLGLDPNGQPYSASAFGGRAQMQRQQQQQMQIQQQQILQQQAMAMLEIANQQQQMPTALHAQLQQQQMQQAQAQMLAAQQAMLLKHCQQRGQAPIDQLEYFQQVAQLQHRVQLQQQQNQVQYDMLQQQQQQQQRDQRNRVEDRARMAFDAFQPARRLQTPLHTPSAVTSSANWRAPSKSPSPPKAPFTPLADVQPTGGRFARAAAAAAAAATASLQASPFEDAGSDGTACSVPTSNSTNQASPTFVTSNDVNETQSLSKSLAREKLFSGLGHGRPSSHDPSRAWSMTLPVPTHSQSHSLAPRAASNAYPGEPVAVVIRQPVGPPTDVQGKNFASRIRQKAASNLGMLNRRTPQL